MVVAGVDIGVGNFTILPTFTHRLVAGRTDSPVDFKVTFEFSLARGPESSTSLPMQFKYKLIMSKNKDPVNSLNVDVPKSEVVYSAMGTKVVQGTWLNVRERWVKMVKSLNRHKCMFVCIQYFACFSNSHVYRPGVNVWKRNASA